MKNITIRLHQASEPMFLKNVSNTYTKGPLFCIRQEDGSTLKFPLRNIFTIKEEGSYSSQAPTKAKCKHCRLPLEITSVTCSKCTIKGSIT